MKSCVTLLFFCIFFYSNAASPSVVNNAGVISILKTGDQSQRERLLIDYIIDFCKEQPTQNPNKLRAEMATTFAEYKLENKEAFNEFADYVAEKYLLHLDAAEKALVEAIKLASKADDKYLLYVFYDELGFLQAYMGSTPDAVYSFGMAKKQSTMLDDAALMAAVDIDLSDIFYRNNFYKQSLFYLREGQTIIAENGLKDQLLKSVIYNNIAENYFSLKNVDSLKKYNGLIHGLDENAFKKYIFSKHTDLYLLMLKHKYYDAVDLLTQLKKDSLYNYNSDDEQDRADSYYHAGNLDSAKSIVNRLVVEPSLAHHPEVKSHLYRLLGVIAEDEGHNERAAVNFKLALQQLEEQNSKLTHIDNIWSQINMDEVQDIYMRREAGFKKERTALLLIVIIAFLIIAIITVIFKATRQKRHFEKIFFNMKKEELHFINSHEVRRHVANILGLMAVIKVGDNKETEYLAAEAYLQSATESLDKSINTISEKLDAE